MLSQRSTLLIAAVIIGMILIVVLTFPQPMMETDTPENPGNHQFPEQNLSIPG